MSKVLVSEEYLSDIADSIRAKNGSQDTYTPGEMSTAIDEIETGGGDSNANFLSTIQDTNFSSRKLNPQITKLPTMNFQGVGSMRYAFQYCTNLEEVTVENTSSSERFDYCFGNCSSLKRVSGLNTSASVNFEGMFYECFELIEAPEMDLSSAPRVNTMFYGCRKLKSIPQYNTSSATNFTAMFQNCTSLENVPVLDANKVTNFSNMFLGCNNLTYESINNILKMCANATSYNGTKTLLTLGPYRTYYPASNVQALSNYQEFVDAGWTLGYE